MNWEWQLSSIPKPWRRGPCNQRQGKIRKHPSIDRRLGPVKKNLLDVDWWFAGAANKAKLAGNGYGHVKPFTLRILAQRVLPPEAPRRVVCELDLKRRLHGRAVAAQYVPYDCESKKNRLPSASIWAVSRDVSKPDIITASPSQTCHSHHSGLRAITFTSSRRGR